MLNNLVKRTRREFTQTLTDLSPADDVLSSTLSTFKSLCKHFSELNYKCDIWHEMKDPDHNAVITVKILYHSKREQISHATLFKNWYILKQQHLKLWLLASCSSRFK